MVRFFLLASLSWIIFGCQDDKFFEKEQLIATQLTNPLNSTEKLDEVVNGTYWMMIGYQENGWTNAYDNYKTWNELGSDAYTITNPVHPLYDALEGSSPWLSRSRDHFQTIGYPDDMAVASVWILSYSNISNVNLVIEIVEEALPGIPYEDEAKDELPRIIGEAYFLRGYHHWIIDQLYGKPFDHDGDNSQGSIIIKQRNSKGLDDINIALSSTQEVYNFMMRDFDSAAVHLPDNVGLGRVSKPAAEAMLVRIHLSMGNWNKVIENATKIIENYDFQLEEDPLLIYARSGNEESSEVIWEFQWSIGHQFQRVGFITPIQSSFYNWIERRSFGFAGPSQTQVRMNPLSSSILEKIGWEDQNNAETPMAVSDRRYQQVFHRSESGSDTRLQSVTGNITQDHVWIFKDARTQENTSGGTDFLSGLYDPRVHVPLIRLGEIILSRAAAYAMIGSENEALQDLNQIRSRAWDSSFGPFVPLTPGNYGMANSLLEAIELERIRELLGEGDRLYYLKAMNMDIPPGDREGVSNVPFDDVTTYWPLPPQETDLNSELGN